MGFLDFLKGNSGSKSPKDEVKITLIYGTGPGGFRKNEKTLSIDIAALNEADRTMVEDRIRKLQIGEWTKCEMPEDLPSEAKNLHSRITRNNKTILKGTEGICEEVSELRRIAFEQHPEVASSLGFKPAYDRGY